MAILSLILGVVGLVTWGLMAIGAVTGLVLGFIARDRARLSPAKYGGRGLAWGGIVTNMLSLVLFFVWLVFPSHVHGPISRNESRVIGDLRTIASAEATYSGINCGFYDRLECLSRPYDCIPTYPTESPYFIDTELASESVKSGYRRTFYPGAKAELTPDEQSQCSPTSLMSFAYVVVPEEPGESGVRAFCTDQTGIICVFHDGVVPPIPNAVCPADCEQLN
jgi:hypothetical protein